MKTVVAIALEEFKTIFRDKGALLILLGAFIIYPLFYPIPYSAGVLKEVPVAVVDENNTALSRKLLRMVDANELVDVRFHALSLDEARHFLEQDLVYGILVIPQDFSKKVLWQEQARVVVYADASYFLIYRQVLSGIFHSTATFSAGVEIQRLWAKSVGGEAAMVRRDPLPVLSVPLFNTPGSYSLFLIPAVFLLILQQTLLIGMGMIGGTAREAASTVNKKMFVASPFQVITGRGAAYFILYCVHSFYLFEILYRVFQFPQKASPGQLALLLMPYLLASVFLAMFLSALFSSRESSLLALVFSSIPILFLSGFSWPVEAMPAVLRYFSWLIPSTHGIQGLIKLSIMDASLADISGNLLVLWGTAILYFSLAVWSKKKGAY